MSPEKLVHMANQIASFFATQPGEDQADRVAQHFRDFWDPRMRTQLKDLAATQGGSLHPLVSKAVASLS